MLSARLRPLDEKKGLGQELGRRSGGLDRALGGRLEEWAIGRGAGTLIRVIN